MFLNCQQAGRNPVPSLERLKPFEGGGDDDDDGLDKDLWVVVEKGSLCVSADCVYRDAVRLFVVLFVATFLLKVERSS